MAPTETLAEQHFVTLEPCLPRLGTPIGLLTGSTPPAAPQDPRPGSRPASSPLVVGTHALIEPAVEFARLAVAVVDEQHGSASSAAEPSTARAAGPRRTSST